MDERPIPEISDHTRRLWQWIGSDTEEMPVTRETVQEFRDAVRGDAENFYAAGHRLAAYCTLDDALVALVRLIVGDE